MTYTVGTLFSGIGVPDLACALLGMDVLFQVEIDDFCQKVLAKHEKEYWPNVRRFTDVRSVGDGNLPVVDILIGGFPCQDLSFAGRRKGMGEGTRSGLWSAFARIIGELQPRIVVIENVPGILAAVRQTRRVHPARKHANVYVSERQRQAPPPVLKVLHQLSEMGYRFSAGCISATELGAQHKRERWWCVAFAVGVPHANGECMEGNRASKQQILRTRPKARVFESAGDRILAHAKRQRRGTGIKYQHSSLKAGWENEKIGCCNRRFPYVLRWSNRGYGKHCIPPTQSRVGRNADGLARGLDFVRPVSTPNEPQFDYEPPRVVTSGLPNRAARIKALGNAWDFRNAYALMYWVNEYLNEQDQS